MAKDTAYKTFQTAIGRAEYLFRLYHGLVDTRQRDIRLDWAKSFCSIMHWNKSSAKNINRVDGKDAILVLREKSSLNRKDFAKHQLTDLLRSGLVMAISAVDAYYHSKIIAHVIKAAKRNEMPAKLAKTRICVQDFIEAQYYERPMMALRNSLNESLGYQSLQTSEKISDSLSLIGVSKFWDEVSKRMNMNKKDIEKDLKHFVKRRNQIAHEGDLSQSTRTRNKSLDIQPKTVNDALGFIKKLIEKSEAEINHQLGI